MAGRKSLIIGLVLSGFSPAVWSQDMGPMVVAAQQIQDQQSGPQLKAADIRQCVPVQAGAQAADGAMKDQVPQKCPAPADEGASLAPDREDHNQQPVTAKADAVLETTQTNFSNLPGAPRPDKSGSVGVEKRHNFFARVFLRRKPGVVTRRVQTAGPAAVPPPPSTDSTHTQQASNKPHRGFWRILFGLPAPAPKASRTVVARRQAPQSNNIDPAVGRGPAAAVQTAVAPRPLQDSAPKSQALDSAVFNQRPNLGFLDLVNAQLNQDVRRISAGVAASRGGGTPALTAGGASTDRPNPAPIQPEKKGGSNPGKFSLSFSAGNLITSPLTGLGRDGRFSAKSVGIAYQFANWRRLFGAEIGVNVPISPDRMSPTQVLDVGTPVPLPDGTVGITNINGKFNFTHYGSVAEVKVLGPALFGRIIPTYKVGLDILKFSQMSVTAEVTDLNGKPLFTLPPSTPIFDQDGNLIFTSPPALLKVAPAMQAGACWGPGFRVKIGGGFSADADWCKNVERGYGQGLIKNPTVPSTISLRYTFRAKKPAPISNKTSPAR